MVRVDETEAIITRALELGVNFIDTANTYAHGTNEETSAKPSVASPCRARTSSSPRRPTSTRDICRGGDRAGDRGDLDAPRRRLPQPLHHPPLRPLHHPPLRLLDSHGRDDGGARQARPRRSCAGARRLRDVRLPAPQPPAGRRRERMDALIEPAEPLQPALPRGRARAHPGRAPVRHEPHAVQPARLGPPHKIDLGLRLGPFDDGRDDAPEVRSRSGDRHADRRARSLRGSTTPSARSR